MNKIKNATSFLAAAMALGLSAMTSQAQLLLSDDFTVSGPGGQNLQSPNFELDGGRQSGSLAPSSYTIVNGNNVQTGSPTNAGQPGGLSNTNYLLISSSTVQNNLVIDANLADGKPLAFSFNLYLSNATANWGAFTLETAGINNVGAPAGQFAFYVRGNGEVNATSGTTYFTSATGVGNTGGLWTVVFSDAAGTGSPFDGNGTLVSLYYDGDLLNDHLLTTAFATDASLRLGFRGFSGILVGVDNLTVTSVPEPATTACLVVAGIGLVAIVRMRRRHS